jgi:hypothetical protein
VVFDGLHFTQNDGVISGREDSEPAANQDRQRIHKHGQAVSFPPMRNTVELILTSHIRHREMP